MKHSIYLLPLSIALSLTSIHISASFLRNSFKNALSAVMPVKHAKNVINKKYTPVRGSTLVIRNNVAGSIQAETTTGSTLTLTAIKQAPKEDINNLIISEDIKNDRITITINGKNIKDKHARVDLKLTIPGNTVLDLATTQGSIAARNLDRHCSATTTQGSITISGATGSIVASATEKGNIHISNARSTVNTSTYTGNICIEEAFGSVFASTYKGAIDAHCVHVPSTCKIQLSSTHGNIKLWLPQEVNADLQARTVHGKVQCQHELTLKPYTTCLDPKAWKRFQRETMAMIGSGEAQILLTSNKSNIHIFKTEQS